MIETLITSKTRVKLLLKFFLNPSSQAYLRGLEAEFEESTNGIRQELNRFEQAGMLISFMSGNKKMFMANIKHPLFQDIQNIILKYVGIDKIIATLAGRLGNLDKVYLTGDYAHGKDSGIIDLIFIGDLDTNYLVQLITKAEQLIQRKIRFLIYTKDDYPQIGDTKDHLLIWNA